MSQANVDLVRQGFETWRRTRQLDFDLLDPDVVWVLHGTPAGDVTYRGRDGVRRWFAEQDDAWSDQWWEVDDCPAFVFHGARRQPPRRSRETPPFAGCPPLP